MKLNTLFPSKWLKHDDLGGKPHDLIIGRLDTEIFGEDEAFANGNEIP